VSGLKSGHDSLFDHLIGPGEYCGRNSKPERFRGYDIHSKREQRGSFERKIAGICPVQNLVE
jgi:hypothetical protein